MNYLHTMKALQIEVYKSIGYNVNLNAFMKKKKLKRKHMNEGRKITQEQA